MPKISLREEQTPQDLAAARTAPGSSGGHSPRDAGAGVMPVSGRGSASLTAAPAEGRSSPRGPARLQPQPPARAPAPPQPPLPGAHGPAGRHQRPRQSPALGRGPRGTTGDGPRAAARSSPHLPAPRPHALTPRGGRLSRKPWRHRARLSAEQRREAALKGQVPAASAAPPRVLAWEEPTRPRERPQGPSIPPRCGTPASGAARAPPGKAPLTPGAAETRERSPTGGTAAGR